MSAQVALFSSANPTSKTPTSSTFDCRFTVMANDQSINSKNGNSSSASTPTTSDRPTQTRLPSMRDLLQDVNPTTNRNPISSHHLHHSNTHHHQTLASSERSTINHRPPSSDDSSSMALDDYPDHVEVADADRRVPSGPGKEIVENWTRTQRLGNDGFNHGELECRVRCRES